MAQARVTDFFSTCKRVDQALVNKDRSVKSVETHIITTRSRAAAAKQIPAKPEIASTVVELVKLVEKEAPVEVEKKKVTKDELKKRIKNFNQKLQKYKEDQAKKTEIQEKKREEEQQKHVESIGKIQEEINKISGKTASTTEEASTPAYIKYAHLASIENEQKLVLPSKYQTLLVLFKGSDTSVKVMFNRGEAITFPRLKNAVQNSTKK